MKQSGFTLIELLVVLAIAVIVITTAIPSFQSFIQSNRISSTVHKFVSTLNLARSEAVKRGARVTVCKSSDARTCNTSSSSGWESGWIVFVDDDGSPGTRDTATEELIRASNGLNGSISISGQEDVQNIISYVGSGFTQTATGGTLSTDKSTLVICDSHKFSSSARAITISTTGSVRSVPATDTTLSSCSL